MPAMARLAALRRRLGGLPVRVPRFEGATLTEADATLAREELERPESWQDERSVREFEQGFASWNRSRAAVSFFGGRSALSAAIAALGLRPGDEVIVPGYTCVVVPNAFRLAGIRVSFADIEPDAYGLDVEAARRAATGRTRAILVHHLYGLVARDYEATVELARQRGWKVIEDCAQASGARWQGKPVGVLGDVAFHSTERTKVLTTGFGGLATTDDADLAERLRRIQDAAAWPSTEATRRVLETIPWLLARQAGLARTVPSPWTSTTKEEEQGHVAPHHGARLPAPLARLGLRQLRSVDANNHRRRRRAAHWDRWVEGAGYKKPVVVEGSMPVFLRYPLLVEPERKADLGWAKPLGVQPGLWFKGQEHPVAVAIPGCPVGAEAVRRCVNLPTLW